MSDDQKNNVIPTDPDGHRGVEESLNGDEILNQVQDDSTLTEAPKKHGIFHHKCKDCEKVKAECAEYKTGWQRALADYKNLQREIEKRRGEWAKLSEVQIIEEFLPVYEHLKLSISNKQIANEASPWLDGVQHVLKQFASILKAHGLEEIKTIGEKFDPAVHEAVGEELVDDIEPGKIVKEIDGGYKLGKQVIKAAKVIVSK